MKLGFSIATKVLAIVNPRGEMGEFFKKIVLTSYIIKRYIIFNDISLNDA